MNEKWFGKIIFNNEGCEQVREFATKAEPEFMHEEHTNIAAYALKECEGME